MHGALVTLLLAAALSMAGAEKKGLSAMTPSPLDPEKLENVCDLQTQVLTMYCYCDFLGKNDGETANCLIFNTTRQEHPIWDTFYHQPNLHHVTISVRSDGSLGFVPTRALTYMNRLWVLIIHNAAIRRIHADAFARSVSLSDLQLARNSIQHLAKHAFSGLVNLTRLNLGENKISVVGRHIFLNVPKLKQLYLDRNRISVIRNNAFSELGHLRELELYDNELESISRGTFKGLTRLKRLDLHRNHLEAIEDRTFQEMPNLKELDLEGNSIKFISENAFSGLSKLMRLNLHDNKLLALLPGTFQGTPSVLYLSISQNVLDSLEEATFRPIMDNMKNFTMYFFMSDNNLRCDCRLAWLIRLRQRTASTHVQAALDAATCHMDGATVPPRLLPGKAAEGAPTPDPALETSTLGIGPPVRLIDLKVSELPCDRPLAEEPAEEEHRGRGERREELDKVEQQKLRSLTSGPEAGSERVTTPAAEVKDSVAQVKDRSGGGAGALGLSCSLLVASVALALYR